MSHLSQAFQQFLSPIQLLFRIICWAPSIRQSSAGQKFINFFCVCITSVHSGITLVIMFSFHLLYVPDDFTNQAVIIIMEWSYIIIMIESALEQHNYHRIVQYCSAFDDLVSSAMPQIDLAAIYNKWKYEYYYKVFGRVVFFGVCHFAGWLIYYGWLKLNVLVVLVGLAKIGIYTKTTQIAFYMDMVVERLALVEQAVWHPGSANELTAMYALVSQICGELNKSLGWSMIALYLQSVVHLVNVAHILYWNLLIGHLSWTTLGLVAFAVTALMPLWTLIEACERCNKKVYWQ